MNDAVVRPGFGNVVSFIHMKTGFQSISTDVMSQHGREEAVPLDDDVLSDGPVPIAGTLVTRRSPGKVSSRMTRRRLTVTADVPSIASSGSSHLSGQDTRASPVSSWGLSKLMGNHDVLNFVRTASTESVSHDLLGCFEVAGLVDGDSLRAAARLPRAEQEKLFAVDMGFSKSDTSNFVAALANFK